ncbi:DEAD/DEAH box helicase domain-containing protein (plasmid) [Calothrix brevissima NIES-22]|nr:DEAD/DEAH box helicase domain-containing protein [Calothrix brevissima NIES-22]
MKLPIKLQDLLQQNQSAIVAASTFISQKLALLDCTGVVTVTSEQLELLFSSIPEDWEFKEFAETLNLSTVNSIFNHQLQEWINQRLGHTQPQSSITNAELSNSKDSGLILRK